MAGELVWVELGPGAFVRADLVVGVRAGGERELDVKLADEVEPRVLDLSAPLAFCASKAAHGVADPASRSSVSALCYGLVHALEAAADLEAGAEVSLRVDAEGIGWRIRRTGARSVPMAGVSAWEFA